MEPSPAELGETKKGSLENDWLLAWRLRNYLATGVSCQESQVGICRVKGRWKGEGRLLSRMTLGCKENRPSPRHLSLPFQS